MFYMYTNKQASPQLFKSLATDATAQKESDEIANVIGKLIHLKMLHDISARLALYAFQGPTNLTSALLANAVMNIGMAAIPQQLSPTNSPAVVSSPGRRPVPAPRKKTPPTKQQQENRSAMETPTETPTATPTETPSSTPNSTPTRTPNRTPTITPPPDYYNITVMDNAQNQVIYMNTHQLRTVNGGATSTDDDETTLSFTYFGGKLRNMASATCFAA